MKPYIAKKLPFNEEINYNEITKQLLKTNASVSKFDGMLIKLATLIDERSLPF